MKPSAAAVAQARLVRSLASPSCFGPSCTAVRVIETHISYVLLTGNDAYKIKKAIKLEFVDKAGNPVTTQDVSVGPVAPHERASFKATGTGAGIVAFRYAPLN